MVLPTRTVYLQNVKTEITQLYLLQTFKWQSKTKQKKVFRDTHFQGHYYIVVKANIVLFCDFT